MLSPKKIAIYPLLVTCLLAASLPISSTYEMVDDPRAMACATGCATEDPVRGGHSSDEPSRCGLDCTNCGLTCCVATAMILAATPTQVTVTPVPAPPLARSLVRPQMDPNPLGHPPRA